MSTPYSSVTAELASDGDAAWFRSRPGRATRVRLFIEGELPGPKSAGRGIACIAVRQLAPGVRMRLTTHLPTLPPDTEAAAAAVVDRLLGQAP